MGGSPTPHPISSRPHFVCKFSRHGDNPSVLRPGSPSITVLVFPDFADAYSRTTASYRLAQLSGQIPESSQFLGASKHKIMHYGETRVVDPYSFFTDPDGGQYGSGSGPNTDPGL